MRIVMVAPYPPPVGGVSVHVKRMKQYLEGNGYTCAVYNEAKRDDIAEQVYKIERYIEFVWQIPFLKGDILHFHSPDIRVRMLLGFYKIFRKKIILTVHGESLYFQLKNAGRIKRFFLINSLRRIDKVICVNERNTQELLTLGFQKQNVMTLPAYVHPIETQYDERGISNEAWDFINKSSFLICANGCVRTSNEKDIYGFDLLIHLLKRIHSNDIQASLFIAVLDVGGQNDSEKAYYESLKDQVSAYHLNDYVYFYEVKDTEFYPILKNSHLFIRPTLMDGFGVSIAEAIYFGVPAIASDVCKRPEGTIVFPSQNMNALEAKTLDVIQHYSTYKEKLSQYKSLDYAERLCDVYKQIVSLEE
ncbi:glycosyltransferase family 4 protein [Bacillus sp. DX4.1]|uniref:glycosyltransferase family 4 protein n=1 Tax=Bacillus sp. DX4.1 TaxID=3055867 RepID=UPI0025A132D9|nr:glycosyltransferase family 4 protein [Bacillus sp. DX4.1]MDM5187896.1 glycosyltransferase family 4 protein [Bacillus sp. DX4.1]